MSDFSPGARRRLRRYAPRPRAAFTLVELLVVVGIIAVLLSILLPIAGKIRQHSREFACLAQMRQVAAAIDVFRQTSDDAYPTQWTAQKVPVTDPDSWVYKLRKILPDLRHYNCTAGSNSEGDVPRAGEVSYLYNGYLSGVHLATDRTVRSGRVRRPAETLLLADHAPFDSGAWTFAYAEGYQSGWYWWYPHPQYSDAVVTPNDARAARRSVCFMDGHGEALAHDTLQQWQADFRLKP
jgi:prepilin-type N-terminal cleavage/methylation domain-containing protein